MRRFLCSVLLVFAVLYVSWPASRLSIMSGKAASRSALVPGMVALSSFSRPAPTFGPGVHLLDPLRYPASDPEYAGQPLPDDEPSVVIAPDGTVWAAALHLHHGTALWRGRFGVASPHFVGQPDGGRGGDDVALATSASISSSIPATLYVATLSHTHQIGATACPGGLVSAAAFSGCTTYPSLAPLGRDRPWLATYGRSTVYLAYGGSTVAVRRSLDGGKTWAAPIDPVADLDGGGTRSLAGTLVVDQRNGALYLPYHDGLKLYSTTSHDGGRTWRSSIITAMSPGQDDANFWPVMAVDGAGTVYAAWSTGSHVDLSFSRDGGASWSTPILVDRGAMGVPQSNVLPWIAAGHAGHVALAWYSAASANSTFPKAAWRVAFADSYDGGTTFARAWATDVVHRGPVCTHGEGCSYTSRQLLDLLGLALDPASGRAAIVYARSTAFGDYLACRAAANCPQVYYVEER